MKRILFLDQSSGLGGAELCLLDIAIDYAFTSLVGLFAEGDFRDALTQRSIPYQLLTSRPLNIRKDSSWLNSLGSISEIVKLVFQVANLSKGFDLIYANTQKAFVIGAISSAISRRPLVYHLHDILSPEHFSTTNLKIAVTLANQFATLVIANSEATRQAFIDSGGKASLVKIVYNGFQASRYAIPSNLRQDLRHSLGIDQKFVIGCFSRLSPWKGQHVLLEALAKCPTSATVLLVGEALYGEDDYVKQLHQKVKDLNLNDRVQFLGFRSDVPELMQACDVIAHTSVTAEPFGRVIVEAMFSQRPVIATAAGGAMELIESGKTGWLTQPGNVEDLIEAISSIHQDEAATQAIIHRAYTQAFDRFHINNTNHQIALLLDSIVSKS
jgi:glycosyltransferase involved in cell wall biosynthesis